MRIREIRIFDMCSQSIKVYLATVAVEPSRFIYIFSSLGVATGSSCSLSKTPSNLPQQGVATSSAQMSPTLQNMETWVDMTCKNDVMDSTSSSEIRVDLVAEILEILL